jgi:hypothetical protein
MDEDDFLAAVEADNTNAPVEDAPEPPKAEEPTQEPVQSAPAEVAPVEPAPTLEPPVVEVPAHAAPGFVPIGAMLDTRDKLKAAEAELAQFRAAQQAQAQQVQIPDRYEDPDGYEAFQEATIQQRLVNITLNTSERFATKEHGKETVEAAKQWAVQRFNADPLYQRQVLGDADPYERVVTDYKRDQLFSKVTDPSDFDAFLAWKTAQGQLQQQAATTAAPQNPGSPIPPRSLASAPSAGGVLTDIVQSDEEAFAELFPKKG